MNALNHLDTLEAEAVYIIREVAALPTGEKAKVAKILVLDRESESVSRRCVKPIRTPGGMRVYDRYRRDCVRGSGGGCIEGVRKDGVVVSGV